MNRRKPSPTQEPSQMFRTGPCCRTTSGRLSKERKQHAVNQAGSALFLVNLSSISANKVKRHVSFFPTPSSMIHHQSGPPLAKKSCRPGLRLPLAPCPARVHPAALPLEVEPQLALSGTWLLWPCTRLRVLSGKDRASSTTSCSPCQSSPLLTSRAPSRGVRLGQFRPTHRRAMSKVATQSGSSC
jgi:hypothetical protein